MSSTSGVPVPGSIVWRDLTVANAPLLRDFYQDVVGWQPEPVPMGGYDDYSMLSSDGECVAGVCHALGVNADMPAQWLIYVAVASLERSIERCKARGGAIVSPARELSGGRCCVIRDPAGAVCALFEPPPAKRVPPGS
jgi:predicted enzyme related to lactoylglutathione lyase